VKRSLAAAIGATVVLAACGAPAAPAQATEPGFPITVDSCGTPVTLTAAPKRVLTIAADSSTTIAAIGATDRLAGRAAEGGSPLDSYAAALEKIPQITTNDEPSREAMIGQQIDTVLSYTGLKTPPEDLAADGITVLHPSWRCGTRQVGFDDVYATLETFGKVFGTSDTADRAIADLRERVDTVTAANAARPRLTAASLYIGENRLSAYGSLSINQAILTALGMTNVFGDVSQRLTDVSLEEVLARDPDVVVLAYGGSETGIKTDADAQRAFLALPSADTLKAAQTGRILPINFAYLVGGPLAVDGLESLAARRAAFT
jgi:iron complex transport system substrate-binding protein